MWAKLANIFVSVGNGVANFLRSISIDGVSIFDLFIFLLVLRGAIFFVRACFENSEGSK